MHQRRPPCAWNEGARALGKVVTPGASSVAARVSKARVRRRRLGFPNRAPPPRHPDRSRQ
eukprot:scaffold28782_cov44-Phaeocystis_antarctica.AAC.2